MKLAWNTPIEQVAERVARIGRDSEVLAEHLEDAGILAENREIGAAFDAAADALYQVQDQVNEALAELAKVYPTAVAGARSIVQGAQAAEAVEQEQPL